MLENKPERQPNHLPERPIKYGGSFIFKGKFPDGTHLQHNTPESQFWSWEQGLYLVLYDEDIRGIRSIYEEAVRDLESIYKSYDGRNGLSREQNVRLNAAFLAISDFNGRPLLYTSVNPGVSPYRRAEATTLRVLDFEGKKEIVCLEAAAIAQQLLSPTDDIYFVTGSLTSDQDLPEALVDLHAFNLIKPDDSAEYPLCLWDITNPHIYTVPDSSDFTWEPYCVPLLLEQLSIFEKGEELVITDSKGTRKYSFSGGSTSNL